MKATLLGIALLATSCTLVETARETLEKANATLDAGKLLVTEIKAEYAMHKAAADLDKSGSTSLPEWLQYVALLLGLSGTGIAAHASAKRNKTQAELDELYDEVRPPATIAAVRLP